MKRKHKKYSRPKRPFDKSRIEEEAELKKTFGLKNKKEIWMANAKINSMREKAKKLIPASSEEQNAFFERLKKVGLNVSSIADVLSLDTKDYLNRRLQTILVNKKMATTSKSARQLITHKKVVVDGSVVNKPSYIVPIELENKIVLKPRREKPKKAEKPAEESKEEKEEVEEEQEPEEKPREKKTE